MEYVPFAGVMALVLWQVAAYPHIAQPRSAIRWEAAEKYFSGEFRNHGFSLQCDLDSSSCAVAWVHASSLSAAVPVPVYNCDTESQMSRDELLTRFIVEAGRYRERTAALELAGVLDGFFQSGLRKACDAATRRAKERVAVSTTLPPFRLGDPVAPEAPLSVVGLEASFSVLSTGLPQRPAYTGDFLARAGWPPRDGSSSAVVRLIAPGGISSLIVLDSSESTSCLPQWPGSGDQTRCASVSVLPCNPGQDGACGRPAVELFGMRNGSVLARVGGNRESHVFSRGFDRLSEDSLLVLSGSSPDLYVGGPGKNRSFILRVHPGGKVPVSRLRMMNGRWQRWVEPSIAQWLQPVLGRYESLAADARIPGGQQVDLTLNMALQGQLERELVRWMSIHDEQAVVSHLQQHYLSAAHTLAANAHEKDHRRAVPAAGITLLDSDSGAVLAVASYPPADALVTEDGVAAFAPGWQERLAGRRAPRWAVRQVLQSLEDRLQNDTNANFATHPIGSTFKPILLSLTIDQNSPMGAPDGLGRLFDLVIAGHNGVGGKPKALLSCTNSTECLKTDAESIVGLPVGPWGREEGGHGGTWIGRWEFLIGSCNKFALSLGVLSLFDWNAHGRNQIACCWNPARDSFGFAHVQTQRQVVPAAGTVIRASQDLPPPGPGIQALGSGISSTGQLGDAPLFARLQHYFGVSPRSQSDAFDSDPWLSCAALQEAKPTAPVGTVAKSQLYFSRFPVGVPFTNVFTGSGQNWWSNVKLAEAYARIASNRRIQASFCDPPAAAAPLFQDTERQGEVVGILSRQRTATWMVSPSISTPNINRWEHDEAAGRTAISKTGTTLRQENNNNTGVFAVVAGSIASRDVTNHLPVGVRGGVAIAAHVDDIGASRDVAQLVDHLFRWITPRFEVGRR